MLKLRIGLVGFIGAAAMAIPGAAMAGGNDQSPMYHVGPNPATCDAGAGGPVSGNVTVHVTGSDMGIVNVVIRNGVPNAVYQVDYRCVTPIGSLTTNSQGTGAAHVATFPLTSGLFYIDVYNGATNDTFVSGPLSTL
jgi:hypothetical protein